MYKLLVVLEVLKALKRTEVRKRPSVKIVNVEIKRIDCE